jgi:putative polyhydroxyalkanoate system protein
MALSRAMIVLRRRHGLGLTRAKQLAETMARKLRDDYGGSYAWTGNALHFRRTAATGCVEVTEDGFRVTVELGLLLTPLRSRIEREIRAFCDEHVDGSAGRGAGERPRSAARRRGGTRPA